VHTYLEGGLVGHLPFCPGGRGKGKGEGKGKGKGAGRCGRRRCAVTLGGRLNSLIGKGRKLKTERSQLP
jgi:hypothetical protein